MQTKINTTGDTHGVFDPHIVRVEMERAFTQAWGKHIESQARRERTAFRSFKRRVAHPLRHEDITAERDETKIQATPSITLADWHSDAPRASGEEQDVVPDEADERVYTYARLLDGGAEMDSAIVAAIGPRPREYGEARRSWNRLANAIHDCADRTARVTVDELMRDRDTLAWLGRDELPAARVAWTEEDENRVVLMNLRYRYADLVRHLAVKTGRPVARVREWPAPLAIVKHAEALKARWDFQAELLRHRLEPTPNTVRICKQALGRTFVTALDEARAARHAREQHTPFARAA